jgi:hypothetical protein
VDHEEGLLEELVPHDLVAVVDVGGQQLTALDGGLSAKAMDDVLQTTGVVLLELL